MIKTKQVMKEIFFEVVGSFLVAIGIYNFAVASDFPMTGFSGIALIIYRIFHLPIGFTTILLNVPVAILCYRLLGKKFFLRSIRCMLINSLMIDYLAPLFPVYTGSRLISAIYAGVLGGLGYAMIYIQNSSTGGTDFIIMAVKALKPYLSLGNIAFLSDVGIIVAGGILFQDVDGIVYGMIINFLFAFMVDRVVYGINTGKCALIVTRHGKDIADGIDDCCGRGSTILRAVGGYQEEKKDVVMTACGNRQMHLVQERVREIDPEAFTIVLESNEVHGEGFHMFEVGEGK